VLDILEVARDLVGATTGFSAAFPPDDGEEGFTNVADALTMSPLLFEGYEAAADKLATIAIGNPAIVTLLSPSFLFRIELDPDPASTDAHPVADYELASRLSYFLWSTMPDDVLFAYADAKRLSSPAIFDMQVRRMLKDPRASTLVDNFASQWLLHTLPGVQPDPQIFPDFDEALLASMTRETKAFMGSFLFEDQSLADLLDAPFSFLDERMSAHYGIAGVHGSEPVRLPAFPRCPSRRRWARCASAWRNIARIPSAPPVTPRWTPSDSRSSTTTPSGAGAKPTRAFRSTRAACCRTATPSTGREISRAP